MQPTIIHLKEKILIGCSCKMNFTENKTGELWQNLMPRLKEIKNKISAEQRGEQQIDFLAGGEAEEGVFLFSRNPQNGELSLRVASYQKP